MGGDGGIGRVLAVDFGEARIGLALSDPTGTIAAPLATIHEKDKGAQTRRVAEAAREHGVGKLLVGIPFHMDGSRGPMAEMAEKFARKLEKETGLPVVRWDERLSSAAAEEVLGELGKTGRRRRSGDLDAMAACLMLREYLDSPAEPGAEEGGRREPGGSR